MHPQALGVRPVDEPLRWVLRSPVVQQRHTIEAKPVTVCMYVRARVCVPSSLMRICMKRHSGNPNPTQSQSPAAPAVAPALDESPGFKPHVALTLGLTPRLEVGSTNCSCGNPQCPCAHTRVRVHLCVVFTRLHVPAARPEGRPSYQPQRRCSCGHRLQAGVHV